MLASATAGLAGATAFERATPRSLLAQTTLTPDAALRELMAGNQRFAANQLTSIQHDLEVPKNHTLRRETARIHSVIDREFEVVEPFSPST
jgi:carbonic anhydrase